MRYELNLYEFTATGEGAGYVFKPRRDDWDPDFIESFDRLVDAKRAFRAFTFDTCAEVHPVAEEYAGMWADAVEFSRLELSCYDEGDEDSETEVLYTKDNLGEDLERAMKRCEEKRRDDPYGDWPPLAWCFDR